jgi:hypothetical protein
VIHVATVHYRDDRWIDLQLDRLARHTSEPLAVHASLERIPGRHRSRFHNVLDHDGYDAEPLPGRDIDRKLDELAAAMSAEAAPDDVIVFMHGDAFPVADWTGPVREMVSEHGLVAIRRDENGEPIPHWSFCATTPALWRRIGGTWAHGGTWEGKGEGEQVTDTGGTLLELLRENEVEWRPLLRTNAVDVHPVFFGVYGELVYHHGAAFRTPMTRRDALAYRDRSVPLRNLEGLKRRAANNVLSRRMYRRARDDESFPAELMRR